MEGVCRASGAPEGRSFGADSEDLFTLNLEFYAEGRANVATLNDGAANQDIARKVSEPQGVVESVAAGIADERMIGGTKAIFILEFIEVGDVLECAGAVGSSARESPVSGR